MRSLLWVGIVCGLAAPAIGRCVAQADATASAGSLSGTYYAIGDSISNDRYVDEQFTQVIVSAFPGLTLDNLGAPGSSAAYSLGTEVAAIPAGSPGCKLITIETGGSDLIDRGTPIATVESEFAQLYRTARQRCPHATIVIATYVNNAQRPDVRGNLDAYNRWLRIFASQNGVPLADLDADRRFNDPPFPSALMRNWAHPSAAGNQLVAQDFIAAIKTAIESEPPRHTRD